MVVLISVVCVIVVVGNAVVVDLAFVGSGVVVKMGHPAASEAFAKLS